MSRPASAKSRVIMFTVFTSQAGIFPALCQCQSSNDHDDELTSRPQPNTSPYDLPGANDPQGRSCS